LRIVFIVAARSVACGEHGAALICPTHEEARFVKERKSREVNRGQREGSLFESCVALSRAVLTLFTSTSIGGAEGRRADELIMFRGQYPTGLNEHFTAEGHADNYLTVRSRAGGSYVR